MRNVNIEPIRGVHIVTDRKTVQEAPTSTPLTIVTAVELALKGGANVVQYRDKEASTAQRIRVGRELREVTRMHGAVLLGNGDVEAALEMEADGIHVWQGDGSISAIRRRIGSRRILGLTVIGEDIDREADDADYLGLTIFPTGTKPDAIPIYLDGLRRMREKTEHGIVAIGGINSVNIVDVFEAGADGVAVIGAALRQADPEQATRRLVEAVPVLNSVS